MNSGLITSFLVKVDISNSQKLDLPLAAVQQLQGVLSRRVTLRNADNKTWSVGVERDGDAYSFTEGWPQFYQENSLEPDYFVIFKYKHKDLFDVKVFGHNACEKIGAGEKDIRVAEEFTVVEEDEDDEDNEEEDEDDSDDEDYVIEMSEPEEAPIQLVRGEVIEIEDDEDEEESTERDWDDEVEETNNKSKAKHKHKHKRSRASSSSVHKKRTLKDYYGHDIFLSGLATQPKNLYFVSRSRHSGNKLNIPREVISGLNLKFPSKFFLVDKNGMKWEAEITEWKDGRLWCTSVWKIMCRQNNIREDDTCICEFVQEGRYGLSMLVRVVDAANAARK